MAGEPIGRLQPDKGTEPGASRLNAGMPIPDLTRSDRAKLALRLILGAYVAFSALNAQAAPSAPPSASPPDRVSAAFGNTVLTTYPDGRHQRIWLHEDGTWDGVSRRGHQTAGRWSLKGEKVCLRQSRPVPLGRQRLALSVLS